MRISSALLALAVTLVTALPLPALAQTEGQAAAQPAGLVQDYEPAPAMWRLADEDTTIYLLGTVHMLPPGFRWRNPQLDRIIDGVDALVLESSDSDADASMAQIGPKMARLAADRTPTSQQLDPVVRVKWRRLVEMSGQPFEAVDSTPLMMALMGFEIGGAMLGPSTYEYGVETVLTREFAQSGRTILSIEDSGRVMMGIYRLDDDLILRDLERDLYLWDGRRADAFFGTQQDLEAEASWELEHDWARGEVQDEMTFGITDSKIAVAFNRVLLTDRNRRWSVWLDDRLEQPGTILVAVGAGHFEGDGSVLDMLRERGLEATRKN